MMYVGLIETVDDVHADSVATRDTVRAWVDQARTAVATWEPAPLPDGWRALPVRRTATQRPVRRTRGWQVWL